MFDDTLLDSSPSRAPVLKAIHWWISIGLGAAAFVFLYFFLQGITGAEAKVLATQAFVLSLAPFFTALMLCYVWADARHLGLGAWGWFVVVLLLNLAGFMVYLIYSAAKTTNWKRATIPLAYIVEAILMGVLILVPLLRTPALGMAQLTTFLTAPPPPPPPPPPPMAPPKIVVHQVSMADLMKAPTVIPKTIQIIKDEPKPPPTGAVGVEGGVPGGVPGGQMGGVLGGVIGGMLGSAPPPPPPKAPTQTRIRVGGQVEAARIIYGPKPEYPQLARMARIQGTVKLEAVISKDGTIQELRVVSATSPLLVQAALDAVRQWRYQPTLLNGEPVEVLTEIDVNFTLGE